jgi:ADP-L-glycero-D-manno-heptose 6-epimerase
VIVVTGALGFIGSALVGELLRLGYGQIVAVDDFSRTEKLANLKEKNVLLHIERSAFFPWFKKHALDIQFVFHIGARTKTNEFDLKVLQELNVRYTQDIWNICTEHSIPLIYASSAATYGSGELGFSDDPNTTLQLKPLNPYGNSKHDLDLWVLKQEQNPPFWAGFKFFNVFGANEYHKERMASVVFHAFHQIQDTGKMRLFKSYKPDYRDGEQRRDFVYIKDVLKVLVHFMEHRKNSGIYNLGSGKAHTFLDLAQGVFQALKQQEHIEFVAMPVDIKNNYQYFTQADLSRLRMAGYTSDFWDFDAAIDDYVNQFLIPQHYL